MRSLKLKWRSLLVLPMFLMAQSVLAQVGGSATPFFPPGQLSVGDGPLPARIELIATGGAFPADVLAGSIKLTLSCGTNSDPWNCPGGPVPGGNVESGVLAIDVTANVMGGSANLNEICNLVNFSFGAPDAVTGEVVITPSVPLSFPNPDDLCTINLDVNVTGTPTQDASGAAGIQTAQGAEFRLINGDDDEGTGTGADTTTIFDCEVSIDKCVITDTNGDGSLADETCETDAVGIAGALTEWRIVVTDEGPGELGGCLLNDAALGVADQEVDFTDGSYEFEQAGICADTENTASVSCNTCDGFDDDNSAEDSATLICESCSVEVDKQVSCDGGVTWFDEDLVVNNEDGTESCNGLTTDEIQVRYNARNPEDNCALSDCNWVESNNAFGQPAEPFNLGNGASLGFTTPASAQCDTAFGDPGNPNEPNSINLTCDAEFGPPVSAEDMASFACLEVDLLVDRNVACDGAAAEDATLVRSNEDGTNGCTTLDDNTVEWNYQSCNNGTAPLYDCVLIDANTDVSPDSILVGDLAAEGCAAPEQTPATNTLDCSDELEVAEAANGKVTLRCCTADVDGITNCGEDDLVEVFDQSDVTCQTQSGLEIAKECVDADADGTDDGTKVTVTASEGDLGFTDCAVTDAIYLDDATCPPVGDGTAVALSNNAYPLPPGTSEESEGDFVPALTDNACNTASVTCLDGAEEEVTEDAAPIVCEVTPDGCITRTGGFWGNRPDTADDYVPVEVCGRSLPSVEAYQQSTTEAICSVGKDGKILGSQVTQLIRQCTVAALNLAVTAEEGGGCPLADEANFADCCGAAVGEGLYCAGEDDGGPSVSTCIDRLDEFNNRLDTLESDVFTGLGSAQPGNCKESRNNGYQPFAHAPVEVVEVAEEEEEEPAPEEEEQEEEEPSQEDIPIPDGC